MKHRLETLALQTAIASLLAVFVVACSKPVDNPGVAPLPTTTVGTDIDDSVITSNVKSVLLADSDVKSFDFKVETRKGEVMLSGFVDNQAQLDRANAATRAVPGVKAVQSNVVLKTGAASTVGNKLDDGITTSKVKAALLADANVKSYDIAVVTRQDEVLLSGFVDNKVQMERAIDIAKAVPGVRHVSNEMSIKK
ncbi:MAG: BON domain-containing protein [Burkholderiales bacterium]|nr:BON domain-containing protein [Burkholderiales bacterium]